MLENEYYVYILIDPRTKLPFYVGKGKGRRFKNHQKEYENQLVYFSEMYNSPVQVLSLKHFVFHELAESNLEYESQLIANLSEEDAFLLEQVLISWFGRKICGNGILTNLLSGGRKGGIYFNEQPLIEIYSRKKLLNEVTKFPKTSTDWVARTLYFYERGSTSYPFKELTIDWLYQYHQCNQQFAVLVIELLEKYDAIITPYYWVRKVINKPFEEDNVYIMNESFLYIDEENDNERAYIAFEEYVEEYNKYAKKI